MPREYKYQQVTFVSLLAFVFGLIFLGSGVVMIHSRYQYFSASIPADAVVLSYEWHPGSGRRSASGTAATIQFRTNDGKVVHTHVAEHGRGQIHEVGQSIRIRYRPEDPKNCQTEAELKQFLDIFAFGMVGFLGIFAGYIAGCAPEVQNAMVRGRAN